MAPTGQSQAKPAKRHIKTMDGLRTLAIIAVIAFHAGIFAGGFLGVSVFFAMSGYLITNSLLKDLARSGSIDLKTFIGHRLRRLFPTMLAVVFVTAILTALFAPDLLRKMQADAIPALGFFANWWFIFNKLSYFAAAGLPSPLTHFWYLGVLGEFYIVWPFVIWGLSKLGDNVLIRRVVFAIGVASFIAMVVMYNPGDDPSRVYYGTDTRFAELMAGAWLAFVCPLSGKLDLRGLPQRLQGGITRLQSENRSRTVEIISVVALTLIVVMCFTLNGQMSFIYYGGLLIVALLTSVIIFCAVITPTLFDDIMGATPFKFIGDRSYQMYLWHYPLLLIMNPATRTTSLEWWEVLLQIAIICTVSFLSYRYIEETTGKGQIGAFFNGLRTGDFTLLQTIKQHRIVSGACIGVTLAAIVLLIIGPAWVAQGFTPNHEDNAEATHTVESADDSSSSSSSSGYWKADGTVNTKKLKVLLIGDSITYDCEEYFHKLFPKGYLDAQVSRQLYVGADVYKQVLATGYKPDVVVLELGSNSIATEEQIEDFLDAVDSKTPVFWVNLRVPSDVQTKNNKLFPEVMEKYDNARGHVIDWYGASTGHDDYFWDDGTHLRPKGIKAYVKLIRDTVVNTLNADHASADNSESSSSSESTESSDSTTSEESPSNSGDSDSSSSSEAS